MSFNTVILILMAFGLILLLAARQRRWLRLATIATNSLIAYGAVVLMLASGEVFFRYLYQDTEGRLASRNWENRYWQENTLGYRDREWVPADWKDKKTILALGDSFTAGWGIDDPADRFTDVLAALLGDRYVVINVGKRGSSTAQQLRMLDNHPLQNPDVILWQYFLNDIEEAALSVGLGPLFDRPPRLVRESYLVNFLYARQNAGFGPQYWAWEYNAYDHAAIWEAHQAELEAMVEAARRRNAQLIVVMFPNMQDPVGSIPYVDRVAHVLEDQGVTDVLKLFDDVAAWDPEAVIVSPRDAHPSVAFHHFVGQKLYDLFFAEDT